MENGTRSEVLRAYHTTPQSATKETPFWLTYRMEAMILVELGSPSFRREIHEEVYQDEAARVELDLIDETREHS